ncbi:MAG: superoxide dismutase family protein [Desulfobulbaceae bacterium]|jgi:Cu-Zn family superoxide dismutase|nr:superoxide dismutase family protein [Desulfobulbaceae bacterium]
MQKKTLMVLASLVLASNAWAETVVPMNAVDDKGEGTAIGEIVAADSQYGLVLTPRLHGLPPGLHGFHVHQNASCAALEKDGKMTSALAAGGHFDPDASGKHGEPWGDGHLGDLPPLYVNNQGEATQPVLAPRLKAADLLGHSLMIHQGGDNHADTPAPLGGGGGRIACGVVK